MLLTTFRRYQTAPSLNITIIQHNTWTLVDRRTDILSHSITSNLVGYVPQHLQQANVLPRREAEVHPSQYSHFSPHPQPEYVG